MRFALVLAVLVAGCVRPVAAPESSLPGSDWILVSLRGEAPVEKSRISLRFDEHAAGGYGGCNWYGGAYDIQGAAIDWGEMTATMRACADRSLMDQEASYLGTLAEVERYEVEDSRLVLLDAGGTPLLEFQRRQALAMDPADLVGTEWTLASMGPAEPVGQPITVDFSAPGTIRGFAGCRGFVARYDARGDTIRLAETRMLGTECHAADEIARQEGDFTTRLSEADHYRLAGDRLEITTAGGSVLVFERGDQRNG
ncbi:MAG: META domain-containing protein [Thermoanaerobaculia bacterium]